MVVVSVLQSVLQCNTCDTHIHLLLGWARCEKGVMSSVNVRNCIRFYQTAEELNASTLMNYCGEIIASHWVSNLSHVCACPAMSMFLDCISS